VARVNAVDVNVNVPWCGVLKNEQFLYRQIFKGVIYI
jgi:hypothetical protein